MTETPEGFLICHDVPISRTGWQEYLGQELGLADMYGKTIKVYRSEDEVFNPAAMASFEGKPVTDEHPNDFVRPDNISAYLKGVTQNVRRGTEEDSDSPIADLVLYDPVIISEVKAGKREISCGYECMYEQMGAEDEYAQKEIRGNHVAVVTAGRAGETVAIKDNRSDIKKMPKTKGARKRNIVGRMIAAFAQDADPEELAEAVEALAGEGADESAPAAPTAADAPGACDEDPMATILQKIAELDAKIDGMCAKKDTDILDELEQDLQEGENSVTVPAEEVGDEDDPATDEDETTDEDGPGPWPGPEAPESSLPENPLPGMDRKTALQLVRTMKPAIAAMKDAKQKRQAIDTLNRIVRQAVTAKPVAKAKDTKSGYAALLAAQVQSAKTKDKKHAAKDTAKERDIGKNIQTRYNPHYKKEGK